MTHGSLFSGIGGFDLAAEWMGWTNVFHCEWMEFPRKVLDYYWPNADSHIDICKTDFTKYANKIDVISGGFPCQPFSLAGKRKGTNDERYLWHEMLRAIQEIKPRFVIAENVFGITNIDGGMVFEQVCLDLEAEGYEVQPFIIPAASKNAPHRRDRCWFIAYRDSNGQHQCNGNDEVNASEGRINAFSNAKQGNGNGDATDTHSGRLERSTEVGWNSNDVKRTSEFGNATDTDIIGWDKVRNDNGKFEKTQQSKCAKQQFSRKYSTQNWWREFPTQSPICSGDDGIPTELDGITFSKWRKESIKGYGNAVCPQVVMELFKSLEAVDWHSK